MDPKADVLIPCRFDPLGLGANKERLTWFAESERVHARWAMLAVAGILVQVMLSLHMHLHLLVILPGRFKPPMEACIYYVDLERHVFVRTYGECIPSVAE